MISLSAGGADADALGGAEPTVVDESVVQRVGVAGHEVARAAGEGYVAAVGRDREADTVAAVGIPLRVVGAHADSLGRAALTVSDEDVVVPVRVSGHEVARQAGEGHVATVGGDRRKAAERVALHFSGTDADALRRADLAVVDEDVVHPVRVPGHEVGGCALEGDVAAVGGDRRRRVAALVRRRSRGVDADALGRAGLAVVHEHVPHAVRVPGHEVASGAQEGHVAAIGGDRGIEAHVVRLRSAGVDADTLDRAGLTVADEDVQDPVRVPGHEIARRTFERHAPAVGGNRRGLAVPVTLHPGGVDADAARHLPRCNSCQQQGGSHAHDRQPARSARTPRPRIASLVHVLRFLRKPAHSTRADGAALVLPARSEMSNTVAGRAGQRCA